MHTAVSLTTLIKSSSSVSMHSRQPSSRLVDIAMSRCSFVAAPQARRPRDVCSLLASLPALPLLRRSSSVVTAPVPWPRSHCSPFLLPRIRSLHRVNPVHASKNYYVAASTLRRAISADSAGESVPQQTVIGLPTRSNCGHQLQYGQECRTFSLLCGGGAKDLCATTLSKCPWPIYPSLSVLSSCRGRRSSGQIRLSSYSSVMKSSSPIANTSVDSGEAQTIEEVWEEYFVDASQWWDNRVDKKNPGSADFKHKVTRKALWIDGWSTPAWVKARLESATEGRLQSHGGYGTRDSAQGRRLSKDNRSVGKEHTVGTSARESRQIGEGGVGSIHVRSARTTVEATGILRNLVQQGISVDSSMYIEVLKRCLKQKDLRAAKEVHECMMESGMEQNTYVANHLVSVYIRCGRLQDARRVFDVLARKNVASWNIMMGGYAQHSHAKDAMKVFDQMLQEGVQPNEVTYLSILKACGSPSALKWGKGVHASIRHSGLESDVRVGTALLQMYAKCGCMKEARQSFENLSSRDVFSWNVMIGAYAESGCGEEAYGLFVQMNREGFKPDAITYVSILNAFASAGTLEWVKEVHRHVLEAGFESDLRVGNALVHGYARSGSIDDAREVFDRMRKRDVVTWNVMIGGCAESGRGVEAYQLYLQMKREDLQPNAITYMNILNACASAGALEWVKQVHGHVQEAGLESDLRVASALVHGYAKSGSIDDARLVFERMEERDVITWTAMIGGYAESGHGEEAYVLFLQMKREGFKPDEITYVSILNSCATAGSMEWVKDVHSHVLEDGFELDLRVGNALIHMYAKSGSVDCARQVFDGMDKRDVITWTAMIGTYAERNCGEEAYRLFLQMQREGCMPNAITYVGILVACASAGALEWVKLVHSHVMAARFDSDLRVGNALVHGYARSGSINDARQVFDRMVERDGVSWNKMIGALAHHGCGHEALEVFRKMNAEGVKPDGYSFVAILSACSHAGLVDEGRRLFGAMSQDYGIEPTVLHYACMVDLLGRAGHLEEAKRFIGNMPVAPDGATWGALLGACRSYGNVELGELAAEELLKLEPNHAGTYVALSNIYAAAGKWNEVSLVRSMMQERGICKEPGCSWIAVDNKIHRFVVGDRSHPEAQEIYAELNRLTEEIKAVGYIPDTRLVSESIDEEDKELALCSHSEKLAIAYGVLRTARGMPIRVHKNLRVCSDCHTATKFISKVTGREIVARDANRFHHFKDGVCSCGDYW